MVRWKFYGTLGPPWLWNIRHPAGHGESGAIRFVLVEMTLE